jgi:hypothetical protein
MPERHFDVTVELTEGEYVVPRGKHEVTWLIRLNDAWIHVSKWPGAEVERCRTKSGMVWENLTRLSVPPGAALQRIDSRPSAHVERDALDYLERAPSGAQRRVIRQEYRVGKRGDLLRTP